MKILVMLALSAMYTTQVPVLAKDPILDGARKVTQVSFSVERAEKKRDGSVIVYAQPMLPITLEMQGLDNQGADGVIQCTAFDKNLAKPGETRVDITLLDCGKRGIFAVSGIDFSEER